MLFKTDKKFHINKYNEWYLQENKTCHVSSIQANKQSSSYKYIMAKKYLQLFILILHFILIFLLFLTWLTYYYLKYYQSCVTSAAAKNNFKRW